MWKYIAIALAIIIGLYVALQYKNFKQWLIYACLEADKYFGSKTGEAKLRYVYDKAACLFITKIITFDMFKKLVDNALKALRAILDENVNIRNLVGGDSDGNCETDGINEADTSEAEQGRDDLFSER